MELEMASKTIHLLIVDDDEIDSELMVWSLQRLKITNPVTIVRDGVEALNALRGEEGFARIPRPYVIFLDINMPRMNGLEFLRIIRQDEDLKQSVVFILTGSKDEQDFIADDVGQVAGYFFKGIGIGEALFELPVLMENYWRVLEFPVAV
jgi:CheY-like chemotaxis protein